MEKKNTYLLNYLSTLCIFSVFWYSCNTKNINTPVTQIDTSSSSLGVWKEMADVPISASNITGRAFATSFVIGNYAYVGLGLSNNEGEPMLSDFWKYDPTNNSWSGVAPMPIQVGRERAVSFVVDGKAYVGTGFSSNIAYDSARVYYNDFYRYDPGNNTWSKIANFPGAVRSDAISFVLNGKGYVSCGTDDSLTKGYNDMYAYDPTSNTWNKEADFPVKNLYGASAFVCNHNNEAYVIGGASFGGYLSTGFYKFTPTTNQWIEIQNLKNYSYAPLMQYANMIPRVSGASFVIDDSVAYITGGEASSIGGLLLNYTWAYYFQNGKWERRPSFTGSPFVGGIAFSINNQGYVGTGLNPEGTPSTVLTSKLYQFNPKGN